MSNMNVKKGDNVMVIAGKDKGKVGKVLAVVTDKNRIYVEGVSIISKSKKPKNAQDKGGILKQEGTIDVSNVMPICASCNQVCRVKHEQQPNKDGKMKSVKICGKCGANLEVKKSAKKVAKKIAKKKAVTADKQ